MLCPGAGRGPQVDCPGVGAAGATVVSLLVQAQKLNGGGRVGSWGRIEGEKFWLQRGDLEVVESGVAGLGMASVVQGIRHSVGGCCIIVGAHKPHWCPQCISIGVHHALAPARA